MLPTASSLHSLIKMKKMHIRSLSLIRNNCPRRSYHSYPDPNEKPIIQQFRANHEKVLNKEDASFQLNDRFKLHSVFPGTPISKGISKDNAPRTVSSKLQNGLTVISQETPGLMVSFALLVKAGRFQLNNIACISIIYCLFFLVLTKLRMV